MMMLSKMLRSLLPVLLVVLPLPALAQNKKGAKAKLPTVEVYEINRSAGTGVILKVSNPTDRTIYFPGYWPAPGYDVEAKRGEKWLVTMASGTPLPGIEVFSLRPGSATLVSIPPSWDEAATRYRFYFYTKEDEKTAEIFSVRSRAITVKELGERGKGGAGDECMDKMEPRAPFTDAEVNKRWREEKKRVDGEKKPEVDPFEGE